MSVPEKKTPKKPRPGGVSDLREKRPRGAGQFNAIVGTAMASQPAKAEPSKRAGKAASVQGFTKNDLKQLKKTEKRYAESRRAATAGGRDTVYD